MWVFDEPFQWSESGLELLRKIRDEINAVGGRVTLMKLIMDENRPYFTQKEHTEANDKYCRLRWIREKRKTYPSSDKLWSKEDVDYVIKNFGRMATVRIAKILERTPNAVRDKFKSSAPDEVKRWVRENGLRSKNFKNDNLKRR